MIAIQSRQNTALRHLIRLGREKKYRRSTGEMLCEGEKMLREALLSKAILKIVLLRENHISPALLSLSEEAEKAGAVLYQAPDALFVQASDVETPQNVIFSCVQIADNAQILKRATQILLLDGIQDPGNVGAILRTAEAFAIDVVVFGEGCADLYAPKVIRATMGAIFRQPIVQTSLLTAIQILQQRNIPVYAAALHTDSLLLSAVSLETAAVLIGSEGRGIRSELLHCADYCVTIPMPGKAESLNASIAAAIFSYEMAQRRAAICPAD